ncbi:MAG: hypothetical protein DRQ78_04695 [Epsilonproteobacteria bacterium]|nr:MAG: hypothetical protein DRQ78_04695 [Campylobacterota bacterium]
MIKVERTVIGTNQLTLEVAKLWMKVDGDAEDVLITSLIDEAKDIMESYINYTITPSTITVTASPRVELCLPYGPVQSITSVKDVDGEDLSYVYEGFCITFDQQVYSVTKPTSVYAQSVTIYEAGTTSIPTGLMLAWKEVVLYLYENRSDSGNIQMLLSQNANLQIFRKKIWI